MADAVSTTVIEDGPRYYTAQFTNTSDGSGEAAVTKIDVSALAQTNHGKTCTGVRISRVWWNTVGMSISMLWDATTNVRCLNFKADDEGSLDFNSFDGLQNYAGTGKTGDVLFTTTGHTNGDTYLVVIEAIKDF
jgi:hypothetical protein